jgi:hypothetical protein
MMFTLAPLPKSRNPDIQAKLKAAREWDLIVCDEAHRMSASFFGGEVKYTKRYQLGQLLGGHARHFLLMTAKRTSTRLQLRSSDLTGASPNDRQ